MEKHQSSNAPSITKRIAETMLNAKHVRNVRNATDERFQDIEKILAFVNARMELWITPKGFTKGVTG